MRALSDLTPHVHRAFAGEGSALSTTWCALVQRGWGCADCILFGPFSSEGLWAKHPADQRHRVRTVEKEEAK